MILRPNKITLNGKAAIVYSEWMCLKELSDLGRLFLNDPELEKRIAKYEIFIHANGEFLVKHDAVSRIVTIESLDVKGPPPYRMKA
jgi:hypothetical protein